MINDRVVGGKFFGKWQDTHIQIMGLSHCWVNMIDNWNAFVLDQRQVDRRFLPA